MSTLADRFKIALNFAGVSRRELAQKCGVTDSAVTFWITGRTKSLAAKTALEAAKALGVSSRWLSEGEGPMITSNVTAISSGANPDDFNVVPIPFYVIRASAGPGCPVIEYDLIPDMTQAYYPRAWFQAHHLSPNHCRMFTVAGESMEPLIWDRDHILVDCSPMSYSEIKDGAVYVFTVFGEMRIKYLFKDSKQGLTIRSANPNIPDETMSRDEMVANCFELIGRVRDRRGCSAL